MEASASRSASEKEMLLGELCREAGLECPAGAEATVIRGITAASGRVRPGWLFVAMPGERTDGRRYIPEAVAAGAAAVLCPPGGAYPPPEGLPVLTSPEDIPIQVLLARLMNLWYDRPGQRLCLVGVTGTNGKTTVTAMLCHILNRAGIPCGQIGTLGYRLPGETELRTCPSADATAAMTTPDPEELYRILSEMAAAGEGKPAPTPAPVVVMEVSSHALTGGRVEPLWFEAGVFTNLSPEHLDHHGDMDSYFAAKESLFRQTRIGIVNGDDRWGRRLLLRPLPVEVFHICRISDRAAGGGLTDAPSAVRCVRVDAGQVRIRGLSGVEFRLTTPDLRMRLTCPMPGEFTVMNALMAAETALALGVSPRAVKDALSDFPGVPGRLERVPVGEAPFSVFIDYAHTPDALERLLLSFHDLCRSASRSSRRPGRILLLFGCGGDRDRSKRREMARIASRLSDVTVITSDNSRSEDPDAIMREILSGMDREAEYAVIPDRAEAIRYALRTARAGDILLLCGKGHETYEIDASGKHPFDERKIVKDFLGT